MRALVVGGTGLLGGAVACALEESGFQVTTLSRTGGGGIGRDVRGDVRVTDLGLDPETSRQLREETTHVVSCFGSVDWAAGPSLAHDLHMEGTRSVLRFAAGCERIERFVHVSSILALGRAEGVIAGGELELGQSFRSWYDYGKYLAERAVHDEWPFPRRAVRLGPVLGVTPHGALATEAGLPAIVPFLLRGYPIAIVDHGRFSAYVCDAMTAGRVIARALQEGDDAPDVWTWFDDRMWSVAQVLTALCEPWGVVPRIVETRALRCLTRLLARPLGVPEPLLNYAEPWVHIPAAVLDRLPQDLPRCPPDYLRASGVAIRARAAELLVG